MSYANTFRKRYCSDKVTVRQLRKCCAEWVFRKHTAGNRHRAVKKSLQKTADAEFRLCVFLLPEEQ